MVSRNKTTINKPPRLIIACSPSEMPLGLSLLMKECIIAAGITKLTTAGINNLKKTLNSIIPFCQTIKVVISPKGLNAPPALAATTILMQEREMKRGLSEPTAITTAHIIKAVVRLSAIGEIKKANIPVIQNNMR